MLSIGFDEWPVTQPPHKSSLAHADESCQITALPFKAS